MEQKSLLLLSDNGELRAVVGELKQPLRDGAGRYRVLVETPELLLLRRSEGGEKESPEHGRVLMAGEIVGPSTVLEVISIITSSHWIGSLDIATPDSHRRLGFFKGVLHHAGSDHPEDRLDKVLFRIGALGPAQIEAAMRDIRPDQRFGELLVERGLLERRKLFEVLRAQMEQTLLSAVLEEVGGYVFTVSDGAAPPPAATANIPLQQLLLTAAERVDRFADFRRLVPSLDLCPEIEPGVDLVGLGAKARLVLGHADGERTVREIASETWLGRFEAVETVYELVRRGHVRLRAPRRNPEEKAKELVAPFNETLRQVYQALDGKGDARRVQDEVRKWITTSPHREILAGSLGSDGLCTTERIAETLALSATRYTVEEILHALHELVSFAVFSASLWLPREEERALSRMVQRQLEKIAG